MLISNTRCETCYSCGCVRTDLVSTKLYRKIKKKIRTTTLCRIFSAIYSLISKNMSQSETNIMYSWILNSKCTVVRYMGKFLYGLRFNWIVCNTFIYHIIFFHRIMICTHLFNANMRFYMEFQNYFLFSIAFSVNAARIRFSFIFFFLNRFCPCFCFIICVTCLITSFTFHHHHRYFS